MLNSSITFKVLPFCTNTAVPALLPCLEASLDVRFWNCVKYPLRFLLNLFNGILYSPILYYTILYYTILYCTVLYCTYCIVLYCTLMHCTVLYCTVLYTVLYYTILYYTILYYTILYYTILYYTILYYTILYYTILYYTNIFACILISTGLKTQVLYPTHTADILRVQNAFKYNHVVLKLTRAAVDHKKNCISPVNTCCIFRSY